MRDWKEEEKSGELNGADTCCGCREKVGGQGWKEMGQGCAFYLLVSGLHLLKSSNVRR